MVLLGILSILLGGEASYLLVLIARRDGAVRELWDPQGYDYKRAEWEAWYRSRQRDEP